MILFPRDREPKIENVERLEISTVPIVAVISGCEKEKNILAFTTKISKT